MQLHFAGRLLRFLHFLKCIHVRPHLSTQEECKTAVAPSMTPGTAAGETPDDRQSDWERIKNCISKLIGTRGLRKRAQCPGKEFPFADVATGFSH
ncbi:hypothetical protein [Cupriavidus sp. YR651]|uniref:hypothetical protein n=1 Tax=Cupriavidus sp. YR651 TaxID=1855315 RepID=UPI001160084B|nr:hypothetical protein [Cupriavidus sp. YR651]